MNEPMTPDPIPAIRQRVEKATPGPWEATHGGGNRCDGISTLFHTHELHEKCWDFPNCPGGREIVTTDGGYYGPNWADAEFIAHAREDIPALLAAWDTQQTALRRLVEQLDARAEAAFVEKMPQKEGWYLAYRWASMQLAALLPPQAEP